MLLYASKRFRKNSQLISTDEIMRLMLAERGLLILLLFLVILPNLSAHAQIVPSPAFYAPSIIPPRYPPMSIPTVGHAPQMFPVSGIKHVLVVAVAFSDVPPTLSIDQIKSAWTETVEAYYHELSFGKITYTKRHIRMVQTSLR